MDLDRLMDIGSRLSASEISAVESQLELQPTDIEQRLKAVGFYRSHYSSVNASVCLLQHLSWLICNQFAIDGLGYVACPYNDSVYEACRQHWLDAAEKAGVDLHVLDNAAKFCLSWNPEDSCRLWLLAKQREPNSAEWSRQLADAFRFRAENADPSEAVGLISEALEFATAAFELQYRGRKSAYLERYGIPFFDAMTKVALGLQATQATKLLASRIVSFIETQDKSSPRELSLLSKSYAILCRVSLLEQNIAVALEHLAVLNSLPIPGRAGSDLDPDLDLVSDLLLYANSEAAVQYLQHSLTAFTLKAQELADEPPKVSAVLSAYLSKLESRRQRDEVLAKWRSRLEDKAQQIEAWIADISLGNKPF